MGPFEDLILYDITEDYTTEIEKETLYDECIFEDEEEEV